ncbi:hypothetical protein M7775_08000 [Sporomusa sphaeroides DSM 2875]|uniref:hypothetical protein n=1 Tax=Sporomusa sphaeroides TaxID=47679 RepID=UPI00202ED374|nr:hypothetical protein [Sporomusa sphaeroides]MCM0758512.1 hypothetical protein [Sporomusa sphaeroides DSM 2875]
MRVQRRYGYINNIPGNADIEFTTVIAFDKVISKISASGMKAHILEYGKGSLMDKDNPYLSEYMNSSLWNPNRRDYDVSGRSKGWYRNADGELMYSDGRAKGRSLEHMRKPEFMPHEAMHIIETEIEAILPEIKEAIAAVVAMVIADMVTNDMKSIKIYI